jgi:hypothetical protein
VIGVQRPTGEIVFPVQPRGSMVMKYCLIALMMLTRQAQELVDLIQAK